MKKLLRKLSLQLFPQYRRLELRCVSWEEADKLLALSIQPPWEIAIPEETNNMIFSVVWLERRQRITE